MKSPLLVIPGIGKSIVKDLNNIDIFSVRDLIGKDPQKLFDESNKIAGSIQDRSSSILLGVLCTSLKLQKLSKTLTNLNGGTGKIKKIECR